MVQAADFGRLHDLSCRGEVDRPQVGRVLVEGEVGSHLVVVGEIAGQDAAEVSLTEDEHVIQALAPNRADEPFGERILPRTVGRRKEVSDAHAFDTMPELLAVDSVTVVEEIGRRSVIREGIDDLLSRPVGSGVLGHVEVDDAPTMVSEHDENEQDA